MNLDLAQAWFEKALENGHESAQVYLDRVKVKKLESQKLALDSKAETESQREAREAKEQIVLLKAEIERFKKAAKRDENAEVSRIIPTTSTETEEAGLAQDNKDENPKQQSLSKKPLMFFELHADIKDKKTEISTIIRKSGLISSTEIDDVVLAQDNKDENPKQKPLNKKPLMFFKL